MTRLALVLLVACSRSEPRREPAAAPPVAPVGSSGPISQTMAVKCLPVVAKACGCVYTCGRGESSDGKTWRVKHDFWKGTELKAVVEPWCVEGKCTDVFSAEIVCAGICPPKPADPTCTCAS